MKSYNEHSGLYCKTLSPKNFKKETPLMHLFYRCNPNNFMQSKYFDLFSIAKTANPGNFPVVAICNMRPSKCPFLLGRKEASGSWAEPYFACHLRCKWGFAYPPGILYRVFIGKKEENRILGSILYGCIKAYRSIRPYANK